MHWGLFVNIQNSLSVGPLSIFALLWDMLGVLQEKCNEDHLHLTEGKDM